MAQEGEAVEAEQGEINSYQNIWIWIIMLSVVFVHLKPLEEKQIIAKVIKVTQ